MMSITIATQTRRYTAKMSEADSERLFDTLIMGMLVDEPAREPESVEPVKTNLVTQEMPVDTPQADLDTLELPTDPDKDEYQVPATGYKGFMYIKCPDCGKIKAFCTKEHMTFFRCSECGNKTILNDLTRLYLYCECEKRSVYWTNMTDFVFDVECVECGAPVSVKHNDNRKCYETIE